MLKNLGITFTCLYSEEDALELRSALNDDVWISPSSVQDRQSIQHDSPYIFKHHGKIIIICCSQNVQLYNTLNTMVS